MKEIHKGYYPVDDDYWPDYPIERELKPIDPYEPKWRPWFGPKPPPIP